MRNVQKTVALVGNPNCGKTTLYNLLTKSGEAVGNRAGVTFTPKAAKMRRFHNFDAKIVDLPGIYSLSPFGSEEKVALRFLDTGHYDVILNIADATNLARGLALTLSLIERGLPVVLALNMMDEAEKEGLMVDCSALSKSLGIPVLPISAAKQSGVDALVLVLAKEQPRPRRVGQFDSEAALFKMAKTLAAQTVSGGRRSSFSDRIDRILCRPALGVPFFFAVIFLLFSLTFSTLGKGATELLELLFSYTEKGLFRLLSSLSVSDYLCRLLTDGIFHGVFSVLSFLPQTAILFLLLALLEDSGYMARAAFVMDGALRPFGLSGKAFIPILIGFGCTVPAVMTASTLSEKEKRTAVFSLPFIPCSARFPVLIMIVSAFFTHNPAIFASLLYILGVTVCLFSAFLITAGKKNAAPPLVIELPKYRLPRLPSLTREVGHRLREFIVRAGTTVFLSSVVIFLLSTLAPDLTLADDTNGSILFRFGNAVAPLLAPIGLADGRLCSALFAGFFAKESIVSTLEILMPEGIGAVLSSAGAASFAVFSLLYTPCAATLSATARELGKKDAFRLLCRCLLFGGAAAFFVYRIALFFAGTL